MTAVRAAHLALVLLLVVTGYAGLQLRRGNLDLVMRLGLATNLAGAGFVWLRSDKPVEGKILLSLASNHGVTAADTLALVPFALAAWSLKDYSGLVLARLKRR